MRVDDARFRLHAFDDDVVRMRATRDRIARGGDVQSHAKERFGRFANHAMLDRRRLAAHEHRIRAADPPRDRLGSRARETGSNETRIGRTRHRKRCRSFEPIDLL